LQAINGARLTSKKEFSVKVRFEFLVPADMATVQLDESYSQELQDFWQEYSDST